MPATYCSLHYHAVFSTKDRYPTITKDWRDNLHAYLGGIVRNVGGVPVAIGGIEDHAHILIGLRATHAIANVMREVKSGSSEWVHNTVGKSSFGWQPGYFGVTVSPSHIERVKRPPYRIALIILHGFFGCGLRAGALSGFFGT